MGCDKENTDLYTLNTAREAFTLIAAIHISINFVLYCIFCPHFKRAIKHILCGNEEEEDLRNEIPNKSQGINIFIVGKKVASKWITNMTSSFNNPSA